jgi:hypothetical protein
MCRRRRIHRLRPKSLGLGAALFVSAVAPAAAFGAASDLLILAGGERRSGALTSCDDERCLFDQAPVRLADLVWIGLGVDEAGEPPRGIPSPGAVLAAAPAEATAPAARAGSAASAGSARSSAIAGQLVGLSLGTVVLDTAELETVELERRAVRWLRIAPVTPPVDILVRRDGALRTGALQGCAAGSCTMAGIAVTRAELAWVGLGASPESIVLPPTPQDPAHDLAQFVDGSSRVTPLVGVGAGNVVLGSGTFPRAEIAWIYLAPPAAEGGPPVIRDPPGQSPPPPAPPEPSPPPQPPPAPPPAPGAPPPSGSGTPTGAPVCDPQLGMTPGSGALWTGTARMYMSMGGPGWLHEDRSHFEVKLREYCEYAVLDLSVTPHRRIGTVTWLDSGGTVQHDWRKEESTGYCLCEGSKTFTEPSWIGGGFYRRTAAGDATAALGFDLPVRPFYYLVLSSTGETMEAPCHGETCGGSAGRSLMQFHAGHHPHVASEGSWDPEMRDLESGALSGRYTKALGPATLEVAWSICRAGVPCPPPPEPETPPQPPPAGGEEEPPGDCDETRVDRAQLDLKMDQLRALLQSLKSAREEHMRIVEQAAQWVGDYEFAMRQCTLWSAARFLVGMLATGAGSGTEIEATKQFWNFLAMVEKVNNGDPSWLLPNHEFKQVFGLSIEDAWDGFTIGYGQLGPSSPAALRQGLEDCAAANIDDVMDGALQYLRLFEQIKPLADRMNEIVNDVVDKDEQIFDFCLSHAEACDDYERCR